ncbi:AAA family ATPase [Sphingomonas sp. NIBR02145]|uniref:AAA family ATPase n=1 Tax=Sphingomonas sp. NIBR02145 TaxID=3014784 RepID=UPI0022B337A7|nr:AAA family ATPase [Sphingomonas sp. NIBR02145]WHU03674.1 AAA family ATPase [Sphingomonas sp. NIBR02145]
MGEALYSSRMYLSEFDLENLGAIREVELRLDRHFNVFAGINGAGKSTLLGAIATMLGRYSAAVRTGRPAGTFDRERIRKGMRSARCVATIVPDGRRPVDGVTWSLGVSRPGRKVKPLTNSSALIEFAAEIGEEIEENPDKASLPLVVLYSVNRAVLDVPLRIRSKVPHSQYAALEDALLQGSRSFRTFFSWFRDREDVENETRSEGSTRRDPQLTAVRKAIHGMMPGFENLRVRRQPLRMLVTKNGQDLRVDELSDGEKCLLAMVGDLARRLALANPGKRNALLGEAIVLIDELELHLHPAWQRNAVVQLRKTFPNCQFIVTTHSAQVLSEVEPEATFLLKDGRAVQPNRSYGLDSNLILQSLMGATARPEWAEEKLDELYELIDEEDYRAARGKFEDLEQRLGAEDPGLVVARSVLSAL